MPVTQFGSRYHSTENKRAPIVNSNSLSFVNHASELWTSLRWKAANAITSSLSPDERNELLQRLKPSKGTKNDVSENVQKSSDELNLENDQGIVSKSIAEAVIAARAEEALRLSSKWEKEKEEIIKQAEIAAHERIQSEIQIQQHRIAFEKWKIELDMEQQKKSEEVQIHNQDEMMLPSTVKNLNNVEDVMSSVQENLTTESVHPILGPIVLDLGYKRIHIVSAKSLASIPVWNKQRIYRHDRVKAMANDKLKTLSIGMPGIIGLHEDKNGKLSILDGQHRVGMMNVLQEKLSKENTKKDVTADAESAFDFDRILVEVYPQSPDHLNVTEDNHATEIFLEVNKAEPVKLIDMPGVVKKSEYKIINEAANTLYESYRDMFSSSAKCRPPHLNIDNLRDAIFASNVISRHTIKSSKQLEKWMLQKNHDLQTKYGSNEGGDMDSILKKNNITKTAYEKAAKYHFYLGLESSWLYE